ncbi:hypothetical protein [Clostridium cochlearium]|uniref:hypothetical protein n=1 Tax=Clostridium cochlearium TaxID=1494 RepID=UPI000BBB9582|nr:hypothetical protein [Clostridium cochlearium]
MKINFEIDDEEIKTEMKNIIAKNLTSNYSYDRNVMQRAIGDAIKEVIYSQKEEIINKVVERASVEIVKKGLPKLIDRL